MAFEGETGASEGWGILEDPCSIKQVLDEHLFLQRRFRRKVFALIRSRKAPSWK